MDETYIESLNLMLETGMINQGKYYQLVEEKTKDEHKRTKFTQECHPGSDTGSVPDDSLYFEAMLTAENTILSSEEYWKTVPLMEKLCSITDEDEEAFIEKVVVDRQDVKYNKKKWESGQINLCWVTGLSGSGKSTLSNGMKNVVIIDLDKLIMTFDRPASFFKDMPEVCKSFVFGAGKKYYMCNGAEAPKNFVAHDKKIIADLVKHIKSYASSHKNQRFVADGVWIALFCSPQTFAGDAVYIKGTSAIKSGYRAGKRGSNQKDTTDTSAIGKIKYAMTAMTRAITTNKKMEAFAKYFLDKMEKEESNQNKKDHKKQKDVRESAVVDEKLKLYESYEMGEISRKELHKELYGTHHQSGMLNWMY